MIMLITGGGALRTCTLTCLNGKVKLLALRHFVRCVEQRAGTPMETDINGIKASGDRQLQSFWNVLHGASQEACARFGTREDNIVSYCKCDFLSLCILKSYIHDRREK